MVQLAGDRRCLPGQSHRGHRAQGDTSRRDSVGTSPAVPGAEYPCGTGWHVAGVPGDPVPRWGHTDPQSIPSCFFGIKPPFWLIPLCDSGSGSALGVQPQPGGGRWAASPPRHIPPHQICFPQKYFEEVPSESPSAALAPHQTRGPRSHSHFPPQPCAPRPHIPGASPPIPCKYWGR